jgi:hypothetical protein
MRRQKIQIDSSPNLRAMKIDTVQAVMFIGSFEDGIVHKYSIEKPICAESVIEKEWWVQSNREVRVIEYWSERREIFVGHAKGVLTVFDSEDHSAPKCNNKLKQA